MYKSSFTKTLAQSRHKSRPRSKSVAARLPPSERVSSTALAAVAAASAQVAKSASSTAAPATGASSDVEFPPRDYKSDIMKLIDEGLKKWMKFMPALPKSRQAEWDLPTIMGECGQLHDELDPSIRLIPSYPASLLSRKKTLACNIAWSVCPYIDVNGKRERAEFNRLFGAQRNGPTRLTDKFVPESVKKHVEKMKNKSKGGDADAEMKE